MPKSYERPLRSLDDALASLERLPQLPSLENLACILHQCREEKSLACTLRLHAYMCKSGLEAHGSLGNYLVPLFVEVGSMCDAQQVFDRLPERNAYSWTSLITGYVECGESQYALVLYQKMQEDSVYPSGHTFVALLKACASLKDAERGHEIHADLAREGLETNLYVGNTLVDMYAKCDLLERAREVFNKLPVRDTVSWNALITAYVKHGFGEEALNCFRQMQLEGISPGVVTYVCSLKACGSIGAIDKGHEIHAEIVRSGWEKDIAVGSTLVDMYAKCGLLAKAREVFDKLPVRDVILWTVLIAGYAEHGSGEEALNCFKQMHLEGVSPSALTFVCSLKACGRVRATDKGQEIHSEIAKKGLLESFIFVGVALVDMYAKCGSLGEAQEVFDNLPVRDVLLWNSLMSGYAEHGLGQETLNCFEQMQLEGVSPDAVTIIYILKACGCIGAKHKGCEIDAEIARRGLLERDLVVGNALVDMYAKCGWPAKAQEAFDKLPVRDVVSWTALIAGYADHGLGQEALKCFEQMQMEGVSPNAVTFLCSLRACGSLGTIDKGQEIHGDIAMKGLLKKHIFFGSTLVDMYAKCGSLGKAQKVFDQLPVRDVVTWTALMAGYGHLGESEYVFHMLDTMRGEGIKPNGVTFLSVLTVCSHTGLVDRGQAYFEAMSKDYGITPTLEHHACMVDLLGRAGQLDQAVAMIEKLPLHPNFVMWHTMLGACREWGNVELGRQAFKHAVQFNENDSAAYVLMSNIYADPHFHGNEWEIEAMRVNEQAWN